MVLSGAIIKHMLKSVDWQKRICPLLLIAKIANVACFKISCVNRSCVLIFNESFESFIEHVQGDCD